MARPKRNQVVFKDQYGTVIPYTRHSDACPIDGRDNSCRCPKWLYIHQRGEKRIQRSAVTPSFADASRQAAAILRGFDPEIAKSRAQEAASEEQKKTIVDACKLWLARTRLQHQVKMRTDGLPISRRERSKNGGTLPQYEVLFRHLQRWAEGKRIIHIQEITPLLLEEWRTSDDWSRLAVTTQQQRWGVLRSFFAYLQGLKVIDSNPFAGIKAITVTKDHLQGPYADEQIDAIFASVEASVPQRSDRAERVVYAQRLTCFLQLLLHTGCDVIDAVLFEPSRIEDVTLEEQVVPVYRYRRKKTKVGAVIPIPPDIATSLRNVPVVTNKPNMPFKPRGTTIEYCAQVWSQRVDRCLEAAQVFYVELPPRWSEGRLGHAQQTRSSSGIRSLSGSSSPGSVLRTSQRCWATRTTRWSVSTMRPGLRGWRTLTSFGCWRSGLRDAIGVSEGPGSRHSLGYAGRNSCA